MRPDQMGRSEAMEELKMETTAGEVQKEPAAQTAVQSPESPLLRKVRTNFGFFGTAAVIYGALFAACLFQNLIGILVPVIFGASFATAVILFGKLGIEIRKDSYFCAAAGTLLGVSTCLTANWYVHFFNYAGFFLLFCIFVLHQVYEDQEWGIMKYLGAILSLVLHAIGSIGYPFMHGYQYLKESKEGKFKHTVGIIAGLLAAIPVLGVIILLLSQADMVFQKLVNRLLFQIVLPENVFGILFFFAFGAFMMYGFLCCICQSFVKSNAKAAGSKDATVVLTVTLLTSAVYIVFSVIQVVYLFSGLGALPAGVTYAEYARQGFFQLLFVAFFNLVLVLWCLKGYRDSGLLRIVLTVISGCTFVMIFSAIYRMCLYVQVYNLTFLRILVLWFLGLLTVLMGGVTVYIYREKLRLFRYFLVAVTCFYLVFSFGKPDVIIARYNISSWENGGERDTYYITHCLSADAAKELITLYGDGSTEQEWVRRYFEDAMRAYKDHSWRQYNASYSQALKLWENRGK